MGHIIWYFSDVESNMAHDVPGKHIIQYDIGYDEAILMERIDESSFIAS